MGRRTHRKVQRKVSGKDIQKQSGSSASRAHPLMTLQQSVGAKAVQRLIESPYIQTKLQAGSGSVSPLPNDVRHFMEPRIRADLSGVRVHTGSDSAQMNKELRSQAFTHGRDIYYANGKSPGKDALTAHELTHVVQQTGAGTGNLINRAPDPQEEKKKSETYWFQNKPPEKPREEKSGIEITPKGRALPLHPCAGRNLCLRGDRRSVLVVQGK
jgi:Domain of unknown function (DUF4157)